MNNLLLTKDQQDILDFVAGRGRFSYLPPGCCCYPSGTTEERRFYQEMLKLENANLVRRVRGDSDEEGPIDVIFMPWEDDAPASRRFPSQRATFNATP